MDKFCIRKVEEGARVFLLVARAEEYCELPSAYLKKMVLENRSTTTCMRVARALCYYADYLDDQSLVFEEVVHMGYNDQLAHFSGFLAFVQAGRHTERESHPKAQTANAYLKAVLGFYEYLERTREFPRLRVTEDRMYSYSSQAGVTRRKNGRRFSGYLKEGKSNVRPATEEMISAGIAVCKSLRDRLLIVLLKETGFRIGELLGVRYTEDIDFEEGRIFVRYREDNANGARQKNAENRSVKVSRDALSMLQAYLAQTSEAHKGSDYLFVTKEGKPLTYSSVYKVFTRIEKTSGYHLTPHMLRRFFASVRIEAGWPLIAVSKMLGHRHIETTERYIYLDEKSLDEAQEKLFEDRKDLFDLEGLVD